METLKRNIFESKRIPMKYMVNAFILIVVSIFVSFFIFKFDIGSAFDGVVFSQNAENEIKKDYILVPLEKIMKAPIQLSQSDPSLIQKIKSAYLVPPSELPYNLKQNDDDPSMGQSAKIKELFNNKRDGFFVECGALDGETRSNTLVFEKVFGWKGVLIEGDPKNFEMVLGKRRKAWTVPACLSTSPFPKMVMFKQQFNIGKISSLEINSKQSGFAQVQCLPLYSILLALNVTAVDYFSLDVEGNELEVLKTIPWDKVNITALSVEYIHDKEGKDAMKFYMENQGYKVHAMVNHPGNLANDFIFYHPQLLSKTSK